jgi:hypothetical protein
LIHQPTEPWRDHPKVINGPQKAGRSAEPGAPFIDLGELRESGGSRCEIRLDLGGGVVLQVVRS